MLIGEYIHAIDEKNRVSLPAKFRKEMGKRVVVTRGLDNCLFLYPVAEWRTISEKFGSLGVGQADTRGFARFMFSGAVELGVDSIGRILIPDYLKEFARISGRVVFAGVHSRVEVWNEKEWAEYKGRIEKEGDSLAEKLGQVGML